MEGWEQHEWSPVGLRILGLLGGEPTQNDGVFWLTFCTPIGQTCNCNILWKSFVVPMMAVATLSVVASAPFSSPNSCFRTCTRLFLIIVNISSVCPIHVTLTFPLDRSIIYRLPAFWSITRTSDDDDRNEGGNDPSAVWESLRTDLQFDMLESGGRRSVVFASEFESSQGFEEL